VEENGDDEQQPTPAALEDPVRSAVEHALHLPPLAMIKLFLEATSI
jgi:hypothetical protein